MHFLNKIRSRWVRVQSGSSKSGPALNLLPILGPSLCLGMVNSIEFESGYTRKLIETQSTYSLTCYHQLKQHKHMKSKERHKCNPTHVWVLYGPSWEHHLLLFEVRWKCIIVHKDEETRSSLLDDEIYKFKAPVI